MDLDPLLLSRLHAGLMLLVFYSDRMGFDEPPGLVEPSNESRH
jgi:hypothetical protein